MMKFTQIRQLSLFDGSAYRCNAIECELTRTGNTHEPSGSRQSLAYIGVFR